MGEANGIYVDNGAIMHYVEMAQRKLFSYEESVILKYFEPESRILDIGCGTGRTTKPLFDMGYKVMGVDLSSKMIRKARQLNPDIRFEVCDIRSMGCFPDSSFDSAIFSFNGMSIVPVKDRQKAFWEVRRVVADNGKFFFTIPYVDMSVQYWRSKVASLALNVADYDDRVKLGNEEFNDNGQVLSMNVIFIDDMLEFLSGCGFEVIQYGSVYECFGANDGLNDTSFWVVRVHKGHF